MAGLHGWLAWRSIFNFSANLPGVLQRNPATAPSIKHHQHHPVFHLLWSVLTGFAAVPPWYFGIRTGLWQGLPRVLKQRERRNDQAPEDPPTQESRYHTAWKSGPSILVCTYFNSIHMFRHGVTNTKCGSTVYSTWYPGPALHRISQTSSTLVVLRRSA